MGGILKRGAMVLVPLLLAAAMLAAAALLWQAGGPEGGAERGWLSGFGGGASGAPAAALPGASSAPGGSPVRRCMNLGNALDAPREGLWGYTIERDHLRTLREAGFDTVRLPVRASAHAGELPPYRLDPRFMTRVDEVIGWGLEEGLNVILDVHHYEALNNAPDAHEPRLEAIWLQLARRYQGYPPQLLFEFINEPYNKMTVARTDRLNRRLLAAVRPLHPRRWIVLGSARWGTLDGLLRSSPPDDPRILLTYHSYEPFDFTHQGADWTDPPRPLGVLWSREEGEAALHAELDQAAAFGRRHGQPVLLGEFGVITEAPLAQRAVWTRTMREGAEARGIGWCYWMFGSSFAAYDTERGQWIEPVRSALLDPAASAAPSEPGAAP